MKMLKAFVLILLAASSHGVRSEQCSSGELKTHEAFQYGRFETRMQSVEGEGVVSSFFLYNIDLGCNWPDENNELDIEMTGNLDASVQFTTHYPGPSSATQIVGMPFNPHQGLHDYAFEWEPGVVRWFVDGNLVYTQDQPFVDGLMYPMRIIMNLWGVNNTNWAGIFDPSVMPASSRYDYVRYYAYTPGTGDAGTGNNFSLQWTDDFDGPIDTDRWDVGEFDGFGGNQCIFVSNNVETINGELRLNMTTPLTTTISQVHFSVDASSLNLLPSDIVYLNGTFNNWCGNCNPMQDSDGDDIWELTLNLPSGEHEYLFTTNGWNGEIGGPVQGSSCDFKPCDQYTNYGIEVPHGASSIQTETYCWASCDSCADTDGDGVPDTIDNCPIDPNPLQLNNDADAEGDACDIDDDNDGLSDVDEMNYDGDPAYDPATDTNPFLADTDGDSYDDAIDPIPLHFNFADGDVAPWGAPDGNVNAADVLVCTQFVLGLKTPDNDDLAHGDLYPVGAPDGSIDMPDYLQLIKLVLD